MSLNCGVVSNNCIAKADSVVKQEQPTAVNQNINSKGLQKDEFKKNHRSNCMIMSESVIKKSGNIFNGNETEYSGAINNKNINLTSENKGIAMFSDANVHGAIADKPIEFTYNKKSFSGNYDGIEFDLKFKSNGISRFFKGEKISGTIDGKEIELNLKNSKVPEDENVRDILSTFLMINGLAPKIKNNQFNGTKLSNWKAREVEMVALNSMMTTQQATTFNSYTPTWHYDNPSCPAYY